MHPAQVAQLGQWCFPPVLAGVTFTQAFQHYFKAGRFFRVLIARVMACLLYTSRCV